MNSEETLNFSKLAGVKAHIEKYSLDDCMKGFEAMTANKAKFRSVIVFS